MSTASKSLLERVRSATEDEYTIEGEIGRGGMAAVFLARDIMLKRRVAIKVLLPELMYEEDIQERFDSEGRTEALLDHPAIVSVYSVKQRAGMSFIVMKYIDGHTLEFFLKGKHALDQAIVVTLVSEVAEALQFAHREGVIHRDVKPSNIIVDSLGRPVVTDFGIAKAPSSKPMTATGSMLGTPTYMSPEQCRGLPATAASDQYSFGVMTYEMLAGRLPFEGAIFKLIHSHCNEPPPPLKELVRDLDPVLDETVTRMLAKSPRDRWPSMSDVVSQFMSSESYRRRPSDVRERIVALAGRRSSERDLRRTEAGFDFSNAEAEAVTTPALALVVTPENPSIEIGETVQLWVSESSGASLGGFQITWKSEDPTVATVDENGLVTGRSVGFAKIAVSGGAAFGRIALAVKPRSVDTVVVTPQSPELVVESEVQFVATVLDARGVALTGQTIVWQSTDVSVCAVSSQGRAIGLAPGRATISASCGDVRGTAQAKVRLPAVERVVIEPGEVEIEVEETKPLSATAFGPAERRLEGRAMTWRSTVPAVVQVDAKGTLTGVSPGTAAVVASCDGKEGLVSVAVRSQPVVAVRIQPERLQLEMGRSIKLKGVGEDRRGRAVTDNGIEWQTDDDQVALVDASGKVHAVREGRTRVRATAGNVTSFVDVTVVPRPAAQVRIDAHEPTLAVGAFLSLDATVCDADGAPLAERRVTWSSSDPEVIAVNAAGTCEAKKAGSVRITAVCDKVRAVTKLDARGPVVVDVVDAVPVVAPRRSRLVATIGSAAVLVLVAAVWIAQRGSGTASSAGGVAQQAPAPTGGDTAPVQTKQPSTEPQAPASPAKNGGPRTDAAVKPPVAARQILEPQRNGTNAAASSPPARGAMVPQARVDSAAAAPAPAVQPAPPPVPLAERSSLTPNAERTSTAPNADSRAPVCGSGSAPAGALGAALANDPVSALGRLYQPEGAADTRTKVSMLTALKDLQNLRASVSAVRSEPNGDSCDWVMLVGFDGSNFVGRARHAAWQVRVRLETAGGSVRIKQLFGATQK